MICNKIGNCNTAINDFERMRIENIQYDTLNYLIIDDLFSTFQYDKCYEKSTLMTKFYHRSLKEINECLYTALDHETYSRV